MRAQHATDYQCLTSLSKEGTPVPIRQATESIPESYFKSLFPDATPGASRFISQEAGGIPKGWTVEGFISGLFSEA